MKHHILKGHALAPYICPGCWYEAIAWRFKKHPKHPLFGWRGTWEKYICWQIGHDLKIECLPGWLIDDINKTQGLETKHDEDVSVVVCNRCLRFLGFG